MSKGRLKLRLTCAVNPEHVRILSLYPHISGYFIAKYQDLASIICSIPVTIDALSILRKLSNSGYRYLP